MPHELDINANGGAAMFSVRETPWHREGIVLTGAPSFADALELGGLGFEVETQPLYFRSEGDMEYHHARGAYATVRTDRNEVLGVVTGRYQPIQNADAFGVLEPLLDAGLATLETGGSLRRGRDVWMLVRFHLDSPLVREVFADEVIPFGLVSNNHAGKRSVTVQETPIRVVCANTLAVALAGRRRAIDVRHTLSVESKTVEAAESLWGSLIERYDAVARQYHQLKCRYLDLETFRKAVLDVIAPIPAELDGVKLTARQEGVRERIVERRRRVSYLWAGGIGHTGDGSAWEALNAAVESIDHDEGIWRTRGKRTASLLDGRLATLKNDVAASLLALTA